MLWLHVNWTFFDFDDAEPHGAMIVINCPLSLPTPGSRGWLGDDNARRHLMYVRICWYYGLTR